MGQSAEWREGDCAQVKTVRIRAIDNFQIQIPASATEVQAGVLNRLNVTRVTTDSGVRGYAFGGGSGARAAGRATTGVLLDPAPFAKVRESLLGADLFAMEQHLQRCVGNGSEDPPTSGGQAHRRRVPISTVDPA